MRYTSPAAYHKPTADEVQALWAAYAQGTNERVPITFASDEQLWLKVARRTFGEFYADPAVHIDVQLQGRLWFQEHVHGDMAPGLPERWDVPVQLWMEENEFFGCHTVYQADDYAWGQPLELDRQDLLAHIAAIDPDDAVRRTDAWRLYQAMEDVAAGMTYHDRPVRVLPPGGGTHGVFTKAAEVRGLERLCTDLYEAPEFAAEYLRLFTEKEIARMAAWRRLTGAPPTQDEWCSYPDDSLQMISPAAYESFVLPCHQRLYAASGRPKRGIHLCGRASQHYRTLHQRLGVTTVDGPGPFIDHARYLRELGPDFCFNAQTEHTVLAYGSPAEVDEMMRGLLAPGARLPGRLNVVGFVSRDAPLANVHACYDAGRRYGATQA